jgi:hypothetical protein
MRHRIHLAATADTCPHPSPSVAIRRHPSPSVAISRQDLRRTMLPAIEDRKHMF